MSDINQMNKEPHVQQNDVSQTKQQIKGQCQDNLLCVNSSQQFQNMSASQSQQVTNSFNELKQSVSDEIRTQQQPAHASTQNHSQNQPETHFNEGSQVQESPHNSENQIQQQNQGEGNEKEPLRNNIEETQQIQVIIQQQSQPQAASECQAVEQTQVVESKQQKQEEKQEEKKGKQVDYEGMVSLKIFQNKINDSLQFKTFGNELFKNRLYEQAIKKYSQGLRILDPQQFYGATQAQCHKMAQVSASLLFNIGSCFFNLSVWRNAQIYFSETITINPDHIKAIYKRALCRYELQDFEGAMSDIKQAFKKDKSNEQIHKSYEKILSRYNEQVKRDKQNLKQMSSKIFRKDSQKSLATSQKSQKSIQENKLEQVKVDQKQSQNKSDLWGFAPLLLVAAGALFLGYKKWFSK